MKKQERRSLLVLLTMCAAAILFGYVPYLRLPFSWFETYFHEISHGLAALATGGGVKSIALRMDGSGVCVSAGGYRFLVAFAGYAGAVLWGVLIYQMAGALKPRHALIATISVIALIILSAVLWVRDGVTLIIMAAMILPLAACVGLRLKRVAKYLLQFTGIYVLLDAARSPLHLFDGRDLGDGATLAELTHLPEFVWISVWLAMAAGGIVWLWRQNAS